MTSRTDATSLIGEFEKTDILIADYDPTWPVRYAAHAIAITAAIGGALMVLEHIGSTAVPDLAAKPIVDILVVVADSADEASYVPPLEAAGYELRVREPAFQQHRMLKTPAKDVNVHVFSEGATEIGRLLAFRDRLRTHPSERKRYEERKRHLATQSWPDVNAYAEAKTDVIEAILAEVGAAGRDSSRS
jgi:GrpB-like predicted nucleotidyltransferase (UPF0157 family)